MDIEIRDYLEYYLKTVDAAVRLLLDTFPVKRPWDIRGVYRLRGVMRQRQPQDENGVASGAVTGTYRFHGIGCRFRMRHGLHVDFDFDHDGEWRGFNEWFLSEFSARNRPKIVMPSALGATSLNRRIEIERMRAAGLLAKYGDLYFFPETLPAKTLEWLEHSKKYDYPTR